MGSLAFLTVQLLIIHFSNSKTDGVPKFRFRIGTGTLFSTGNAENSIPKPRAGAAAWPHRNSREIFVFGGFSNSEDDRYDTFVLNDFMVYDSEANLWSIFENAPRDPISRYDSGSMWPGARYGACAYSMQGVLELFGGKGHSNNSETEILLADKWSYDEKEKEWSCDPCENRDKVPAPAGSITPGSKFFATTFQMGAAEVYIFGGSGYSDWKVGTGGFSRIGGSRIPFETGSSTQPPAMYGACGWTFKSSLYLFGGRTIVPNANNFPPTEHDLRYLNTLFVYSTKLSTWELLGGELGASNDFGCGENPTQTQRGEKPFVSEQELSDQCTTLWPGARAFHHTFVRDKNLWLFGGIGEEVFTIGSEEYRDGKAYSHFWYYSTQSKRWQRDKTFSFPDGVGGHYLTKDEFAPENHIGSRYMANVVPVQQSGEEEKEESIFILFGWGTDSVGARVGIFEDPMMATTDEVWELRIPPPDYALIFSIISGVSLPVVFGVVLVGAVLVILVLGVGKGRRRREVEAVEDVVTGKE